MPRAAGSMALPLVPASFFGMVLGIGGLGAAWRIATRLWGLPGIVGEVLSLAAVAIWAVWLLLFAWKWIATPAAARAEAVDPAIGFGVGLMPMATMLVSVALKPYLPGVAWLVFAAGLAAGLMFAVWVIGRAWQGGRVVAGITPLMYLSPVGAGFLGAMGAGAFGHQDLATLLWGAGAISWIFLEAAVLQRLMHEAMPLPMRAMVGIQLAPPAVGCMSYLAFTDGPADRVALFLLGYALFQGLVLVRLVPWLRQQPFGGGAWSYTFGVAALAVSVLGIAERGGQAGIIASIAPAVFVFANLMIGWIAARTVQLATAGRLFPALPPVTSPVGKGAAE